MQKMKPALRVSDIVSLMSKQRELQQKEIEIGRPKTATSSDMSAGTAASGFWAPLYVKWFIETEDANRDDLLYFVPVMVTKPKAAPEVKQDPVIVVRRGSSQVPAAGDPG